MFFQKSTIFPFLFQFLKPPGIPPLVIDNYSLEMSGVSSGYNSEVNLYLSPRELDYGVDEFLRNLRLPKMLVTFCSTWESRIKVETELRTFLMLKRNGFSSVLPVSLFATI